MVQQLEAEVSLECRGKVVGCGCAFFSILSLCDEEIFREKISLTDMVGVDPSMAAAETSACRTASSIFLIAASLASFLLIVSSAVRFLEFSCCRCWCTRA